MGHGTTWEAALAEVSGPRSRYAIIESEIDRRRCKIFEHTPPSLRAIFDTGRERSQDICLVYEDERRSFAEVMAKIDALAAAHARRSCSRGQDPQASASRRTAGRARRLMTRRGPGPWRRPSRACCRNGKPKQIQRLRKPPGKKFAKRITSAPKGAPD
jgi:hypothetical protein